MAAAPRVAVVGGGLSGSLAALGLRARGLAPVLYDGGGGTGGRLGGASRGPRPELGLQFFRAEHERFASLLRALEQRGAAAPWSGEFGLLGSRGGGYLSASNVPKRGVGGAAAVEEARARGLRDSGDFCGFVDGGPGELWAARDNGAVCAALRAMGGGLDLRSGVTVDRVEWQSGGAWRVVSNGGGGGGDDGDFDAVVVATHDPAFAARALATVDVRGIYADRLAELTAALRGLATNSRAPLVSLAVTVAGVDAPFDAATVPGSENLQFVARERSKRPDAPEDLWTAVSTSAFADACVARGAPFDEEAAAAALADEVRALLRPHGATAATTADCKLWRAALTDGTLEDWSRNEEDAIFLEPFSLAIAGDFVRKRACPAEAAALSGLEAGQRLGDFLARAPRPGAAPPS